MSSWAYFNSLYTCMITTSSITKINDRTVHVVVGAHQDGRGDKDVEAIWFNNTEVKFFPRGLRSIFPHLKVVSINKCGLKEVTQDDMRGLENLEAIYLEYNSLKSLPSSLLQDMSKLRRIGFVGNKLKYVSSKLLDPIINNGLSYVNFRSNKNIDSFYHSGHQGSVGSIEELMIVIDKNCKPPKDEAIDLDETSMKEAHKAKLSHAALATMTAPDLSDFTIIVNSKKFPVHKWVLSTQSLFFREMFQDSEKKIYEMKIEDISPEAVDNFIRYLYQGEFPEPKNAIDAFKLAAKLEVHELKPICEKIICKRVLDESNAIEVFLLGYSQASEKMQRAGFDQIKSMFSDTKFPESMMENPRDLKDMVQLLQKHK